MNPSPALPRVVCILVGGGLLLAAGPRAGAADEIEGVTAVASKVSGDYVRAKLPDGSFQPEYYAFGKGGQWGGEMRDATIDELRFEDVARVIAGPLASQDYLPAREAAKAKLLIMVYWGTTAVPGPSSDSFAFNNFTEAQNAMNQATNSNNPMPKGVQDALTSKMASAMTLIDMENHQRDRLDVMNAKMLGYDADGLIGTDYGKDIKNRVLGLTQRDEVAEIEQNRYFVVLMAYDFQLMWKEKKHRLLWETRFSISERHNQFDKALPVMAQYASRYFGQPSNGLLRARVPEGRVDIGEVKSLGPVPEK